MNAEAPIGVLDSGLGGLSVVRELRAQLPAEALLYFADQIHVPYGRRPAAELRAFTEAIVDTLLARGAKLIVLACNTASAVALHHLRQTRPDVPFVGMEPAVKPAVQNTRTGKIGVIATPATFQGELFASVVGRFAQPAAVDVFTHVCPGFVEAVEAGAVATPETAALVRTTLAPLLAQGIDQLVLACTHYPFLAPLIAQAAGPTVTLIDPSPAVARQVGRMLATHHLLAAPSPTPMPTFLTSGPRDIFRARLLDLLGPTYASADVQSAHWRYTVS